MSLEADPRAGFNQLTEIKEHLPQPAAPLLEIKVIDHDLLPAVKVNLSSAIRNYLSVGAYPVGSGPQEELLAIAQVASATASENLVLETIAGSLQSFPEGKMRLFTSRAVELIYVLDSDFELLGQLLKNSRESQHRSGPLFESLMLSAAESLINLKDGEGTFLSLEERKNLLVKTVNLLEGRTDIPTKFINFVKNTLEEDLAEQLTDEEWQPIFDITVKYGLVHHAEPLLVLTRLPEKLFHKAANTGQDESLVRYLQEGAFMPSRLDIAKLHEIEKLMAKFPDNEKYTGLMMEILFNLQKRVAYYYRKNHLNPIMCQKDLESLYELVTARWNNVSVEAAGRIISADHLAETVNINEIVHQFYELRKDSFAISAFFSDLWTKAAKKEKNRLMKRMKQEKHYAFFAAALEYDDPFLTHKDKKGSPNWLSLLASMDRDDQQKAAKAIKIKDWYQDQELFEILLRTQKMDLCYLFPQIKMSAAYLEYRKDAWTKRYKEIERELETQMVPLLNGEDGNPANLFDLFNSFNDYDLDKEQLELIKGLERQVITSILQSLTTLFRVKRQLDDNWITDRYDFKKEELRLFLQKLKLYQILPHIEKLYIRSCLEVRNAESVRSLIDDYDQQLLKEESQFFDLVMTEIPIEVLEASDASGQRIEDLIGERVISWLSTKFQQLKEYAFSNNTTLDSVFNETELWNFIDKIATVERRWRNWLNNHLKESRKGSLSLRDLNSLIALVQKQ